MPLSLKKKLERCSISLCPSPFLACGGRWDLSENNYKNAFQFSTLLRVGLQQFWRYFSPYVSPRFYPSTMYMIFPDELLARKVKISDSRTNDHSIKNPNQPTTAMIDSYPFRVVSRTWGPSTNQRSPPNTWHLKSEKTLALDCYADWRLHWIQASFSQWVLSLWILSITQVFSARLFIDNWNISNHHRICSVLYTFSGDLCTIGSYGNQEGIFLDPDTQIIDLIYSITDFSVIPPKLWGSIKPML